MLAAGLSVLASAAQAECVSEACNAKLTTAVWMFGCFVILGIVILIMLIRAKWRRSGLFLLGLSLAVFAGIPLLSQGWIAMQKMAMERREVLGQPPSMADRTPLVIAQPLGCSVGACDAVLRGRGAAGAYVVKADALAGLDVTGPVALADLPLEFLTFVEGAKDPQARALTPAERQEAASVIDYVILEGPALGGYRYDPFKLNTFGAIDPLLRGNPALAGQSAREYVQLAMGPIDAGSGILKLTELRLDLLELWFFGNALALPLSPGNWDQTGNDTATADLAAQSLCPVVNGEQDWFCVNALK